MKIRGDEQLLKALRRKGEIAGYKAAVKQSGAELRNKAVRSAPRVTRHLMRNINLYIENDGMQARITAEAEYSGYVEYGTRKMSAQPYLRPAYYEQYRVFILQLQRLLNER